MLKVRLTRTGRSKRPSYRVVVAEHSSPRDGRVVERLGYYDPLSDPKVFKVNEERVKHWLSHGAQPSRTVQGLLAKQGADGALASETDEQARAGQAGGRHSRQGGRGGAGGRRRSRGPEHR